MKVTTSCIALGWVKVATSCIALGWVKVTTSCIALGWVKVTPFCTACTTVPKPTYICMHVRIYLISCGCCETSVSCLPNHTTPSYCWEWGSCFVKCSALLGQLENVQFRVCQITEGPLDSTCIVTVQCSTKTLVSQ